MSRLVTSMNARDPNDGGSSWDAIFNVVVGTAPSCGAALTDGGFGGQTCVAGADQPDEPTDNLVYSNVGSTAQTAFIIVDGYGTSTTGSSSNQGPFSLTTNVVVIPNGDICQNADVLTLPASRTADTLTGFISDYAAGSGCASGTSGPDRVYRVTVPSGSRLSATATASTNSDGGIAFAPTIAIVAATACTPTLTCLGSGSSVAGSAAARYDNVGAAVDVFVVVDTATTAPGGTFSLSVTATPITLAAGDVCGNVGTAITASQTLQTETLSGYQDQYQSQFQTSCAYRAGIDRAYAVTIPVGQIMTAVATPTDAGVLPDGGVLSLSLQVLAAGTACETGPCLSSSSASGAAAQQVVRSNVTGTAAQSVLLVVDTNVQTALGSYSLEVNLAVPPQGDRCDSPIALTLGTPANGNLAAFGDDYSSTTTGCTLPTGRDVAYSLTIPAMQRATVSVTPTGFDSVLQLVTNAAACGTACLARNDTGATGGVDSLVYDNVTASPLSVLVLVDSFSGTGTFVVSATAAPLPSQLLPGETCSSAVVLTPGVTVTGTLAGFSNDIIHGDVNACLGVSSLGGPDGVYSVAVPSNQRMTATVVPTFDATLNAVVGGAANCGSIGPDGGTSGITCVSGSDNFGIASETVSFANTSGASQSVLLLIDTVTAGTDGGSYDISATLAAIPAGDLCSDSLTAITATSTLTGQTLAGFGNDFTFRTGCSFASGPDRVYRITIPAMSRLTATTTTPVVADHGLSIIDGLAAACSGTVTCVANVDADPTGGGETINYDNNTAAAKTVFLVVDRFSGADGFDLSVTMGPVVANQGETCQLPQAIAMSGTLTGQTLVGYANDVATSSAVCTTYSNSGPDRVYSISVPAGLTLTATVTPTSSWDPAIYIIDSAVCGPSVAACLSATGSGDSGGSGSPDTVTYTNSGGAAQTVYVVVDRYLSGTVGGFDLTIGL